jgi:hypothetical protein
MLILNNSIFSASAVHNKSGCSNVTPAVKLPWRPSNISNLITSPSSYQCIRRKTRLVYFVMYGRHISMECMCAYCHWGSPNREKFLSRFQRPALYRRSYYPFLMHELAFVAVVILLWLLRCWTAKSMQTSKLHYINFHQYKNTNNTNHL